MPNRLPDQEQDLDDKAYKPPICGTAAMSKWVDSWPEEIRQAWDLLAREERLAQQNNDNETLERLELEGILLLKKTAASGHDQGLLLREEE